MQHHFAQVCIEHNPIIVQTMHILNNVMNALMDALSIANLLLPLIQIDEVSKSVIMFQDIAHAHHIGMKGSLIKGM